MDQEPPQIPQTLWAAVTEDVGEGKKKKSVHSLKLASEVVEGELCWESDKGARVCTRGGKWVVEVSGRQVGGSEKASTEGWLPHEAGWGEACVVTAAPPRFENPARPPLKLSLCGHRQSNLKNSLDSARVELKRLSLHRRQEARGLELDRQHAQAMYENVQAVRTEPPPLEGHAAGRERFQRGVLGGNPAHHMREHMPTVVPPDQLHDVTIMMTVPVHASRDYALQRQATAADRQYAFEKELVSSLITPYRPPTVGPSPGLRGISTHLDTLRRQCNPLHTMPRSSAVTSPTRPEHGTPVSSLREVKPSGRWLQSPVHKLQPAALP